MPRPVPRAGIRRLARRGLSMISQNRSPAAKEGAPPIARPVKRRRKRPAGFLSSLRVRLAMRRRSRQGPRDSKSAATGGPVTIRFESAAISPPAPLPGQVIVEIGCVDFAGCMETLRRLGPTGKLVAIDSSAAAIASARRQLADCDAVNIEFHLCRIDSIPLPSGTCDWVISRAPVCMAGSRMAVLREIRRVLRPGGHMVLHDVAIKRLLPPELADSLTAHSFGLSGAIEPGSYEKLLQKAGLSNVQMDIYDLGDHLHQIFEPLKKSAAWNGAGHTGSSSLKSERRQSGPHNAYFPAGIAWAGHKLTDYLTAIRLHAIKKAELESVGSSTAGPRALRQSA